MDDYRDVDRMIHDRMLNALLEIERTTTDPAAKGIAEKALTEGPYPIKDTLRGWKVTP